MKPLFTFAISTIAAGFLAGSSAATSLEKLIKASDPSSCQSLTDAAVTVCGLDASWSLLESNDYGDSFEAFYQPLANPSAEASVYRSSGTGHGGVSDAQAYLDGFGANLIRFVLGTPENISASSRRTVFYEGVIIDEIRMQRDAASSYHVIILSATQDISTGVMTFETHPHTNAPGTVSSKAEVDAMAASLRSAITISGRSLDEVLGGDG
ncbi:MAG: hypothetical protein AAGA15_05285 [Pseudomonadota bacterium]